MVRLLADRRWHRNESGPVSFSKYSALMTRNLGQHDVCSFSDTRAYGIASGRIITSSASLSLAVRFVFLVSDSLTMSLDWLLKRGGPHNRCFVEMLCQFFARRRARLVTNRALIGLVCVASFALVGPRTVYIGGLLDRLASSVIRQSH